jgi:hypothetical protein
MACIRMFGAIVTIHPGFQLHVGNHYIFGSFHEYCGPIFFTDRNETKEYIPKDEDDPVWPVFYAWLKKYEARKAKQKASYKNTKAP